MYDKNPKLIPAQLIINRIQSRDLYCCIGETSYKNDVTNYMCNAADDEIACQIIKYANQYMNSSSSGNNCNSSNSGNDGNSSGSGSNNGSGSSGGGTTSMLLTTTPGQSPDTSMIIDNTPPQHNNTNTTNTTHSTTPTTYLQYIH